LEAAGEPITRPGESRGQQTAGQQTGQELALHAMAALFIACSIRRRQRIQPAWHLAVVAFFCIVSAAAAMLEPRA
jgi:hypothetical protein